MCIFLSCGFARYDLLSITELSCVQERVYLVLAGVCAGDCCLPQFLSGDVRNFQLFSCSLCISPFTSFWAILCVLSKN